MENLEKTLDGEEYASYLLDFLEERKMKRANLVTGGCGFVGSHLCEALLAAGESVVVIDDLSTGAYTNVEHIDGNPDFSLVIASVLDQALVTELIRRADRVFHLASAVGVRLIMEQPVRTIETIFHGTDSVLKAANKFRRPVLLTSTSEVYGKSVDAPFREDSDRVEGPTSKNRWAYSCAKTLDEFLALAYWKETRLPVTIARLFNTVGPRQTGQYGMVIPNFVERALRNEPLLVHGDGTQSRCFGHVRDVVRALIGMMNEPRCRGQVINVGSQEEVTILGLANKIIKICGSASQVRLIPYSDAYSEGFEDMLRRVPSLEKVSRLIGWSPVADLDTIIRDVVASMREKSQG